VSGGDKHRNGRARVCQHRVMRDVPVGEEVGRPGGCGHDVGGPCLFRVMYSSWGADRGGGAVGAGKQKKKVCQRDRPVSVKRWPVQCRQGISSVCVVAPSCWRSGVAARQCKRRAHAADVHSSFRYFGRVGHEEHEGAREAGVSAQKGGKSRLTY